METKQEPPLSELPTDETPKEQSMKEMLIDVNKKLETLAPQEKEKGWKKFKLPFWKVRTKINSVKKSGKKALVIYLHNMTIKPMVCDIVNGWVCIEGVYHNAGTGFMFLWEGKLPALVIPSYSVNPIGPKHYYDALKNKEASVEAQKLLIRAMKMAQIQDEDKKKPNFKFIIIVALVVGAAAWILFHKKAPVAGA